MRKVASPIGYRWIALEDGRNRTLSAATILIEIEFEFRKKLFACRKMLPHLSPSCPALP